MIQHQILILHQQIIITIRVLYHFYFLSSSDKFFNNTGVSNNSSNNNNNGNNGNVICTLCRRQFSSPEQLQRHEKESKLHAENLAKQNLAQQQSQTQTQNQQQQQPVVYRDRASERRAIYGQSEIPDESEFGRKDEVFNRGKRRAGSITEYFIDNNGNNNNSSSSTSNTTPPTVLIEDTNNPGNQLLRRMGWSDGQGLGKDSSGRVESVAESVNAASTGRGQTKVGIGSAELPQVNYSSDSNYRESLKKATKARYEQVCSQTTTTTTTTEINK